MLTLKTWLLIAVTAFTSIFAGQKVVLFNDTSAWYHWGCTGTSITLKEGIEKLGFEIHAFPINVTYALKKVPSFEEFHIASKFDQFSEQNKDIIQALQNASAVVINGEGTIHDLRDGPKALLYLAYISKEFLGKHVEIVNHSAYPKDDPDLSSDFLKNFGVEKVEYRLSKEQAKTIYKNIYHRLDFIAIREPISQDEMKKIGISSTLSFDCLPLYIRDHYHTPKQVKEKTLAVAGSVAFSEKGTKELCHYLEEMSRAGFEIKVLIGAAAFPAKDDQSFIKLLKKHCGVPLKIVNARSMEEWLNTINHAALFVSGRLHHSIAAFCLNTPLIALNSNTYKVHGVCSILNQNEPLLFSDPQLANQLSLRTKTILSSPDIKNDEKVLEICQLAERNFDGLKRLAEKK